MLGRVQIEYIKWLYHREHLSIRAIAKKVGSSRKTVRKVLALEDPRDHKYTKTFPRPCPVMGPVMPIIEAWLEADKDKPKKRKRQILPTLAPSPSLGDNLPQKTN